MEFRIVPGLRKGANLLTSGDGYYFYSKHTNKTKTDFRCYKYNCLARVYVLVGSNVPHNNEDLPVHNHDPEPLLESVNCLKDRIMKRVESESLPLKTIFNDECNKVHVNVASQLCFGRLESTLQKVRRKNVPSLPQNAEEFDTRLNSEEWHGRFAYSLSGNQFYRENIVVGENNNLVFLSENLQQLLSTSEEIHVDGTFKTVPSVPEIKQLFVVMAVAFDHAFAVCFVLMERRTYESYKSVFECLKQLTPAINPHTIMSDFESGIMKAAHEVFPDAVIKGCWWHYANRILKKSKSLRLLPEMRRQESLRLTIHMCMAFPLLPPEKIQQELDATKEMIERETFAPVVNNSLFALLAYIQAQWLQTNLLTHPPCYSYGE